MMVQQAFEMDSAGPASHTELNAKSAMVLNTFECPVHAESCVTHDFYFKRLQQRQRAVGCCATTWLPLFCPGNSPEGKSCGKQFRNLSTFRTNIDWFLGILLRFGSSFQKYHHPSSCLSIAPHLPPNGLEKVNSSLFCAMVPVVAGTILSCSALAFRHIRLKVLRSEEKLTRSPTLHQSKVLLLLMMMMMMMMMMMTMNMKIPHEHHNMKFRERTPKSSSGMWSC